MKICLITRECFPFSGGGIGTAFYSMGKMLANFNHEVILLTKKPANFNQEVYNKHYSNNFKTEWVDYTEGAFSVHNLLDYSYQLEKHFDRFHDSFQPALVMFAEYDGEAYFLLHEKNKGIKYPNTAFVVHFSGPLFAMQAAENKIPSPYEELIYKLEAYCIQASSFAIAPSAFILNNLKQQFNLQHQQHFIIPNPINNTVFTEPVPPVYVVNTKVKNILYIGRLQKTKGVDYLIQAFQQLVESGNENIRLQLVGKDVLWSDYNMTFQEYCQGRVPENVLSKIDFIGHISQDDMFSYHKQAYIAVFPSRFETFGNVALECIYNGVPVIVSKNTGLADVTGNDYSYFWNEEDGVGSLTALMQNALADPALRNDLSSKSHKRAMYLHAHLPGQLISTFQEIVAAGNKSAPAFTAVNEQIFLLLNQYSAFWQQEKKIEIQSVYEQKDEELKNAWEKFDHKDKELAALWQKHNEEIKDIWSKYDEKDKQILDVWKQYDSKDAVLQDIQQRFIALAEQQGSNQQQYIGFQQLYGDLQKLFTELQQQFGQLQTQDRELQQQHIELQKQNRDIQLQNHELQQQNIELQKQNSQFQQNDIHLLQRHNDTLQEYLTLQNEYHQLQQQYNEMLTPYNQLLVQHEKLTKQLITLNKNIEKYLNNNLSKVIPIDDKDILPEIELLYYQIGMLKRKRRFFF